jgi:hypothetical protein
MSKSRKYTKDEISKAIDEAFAAGYQSAMKGKRPPSGAADLQIAHLAKTIDNNAKKINDELMKMHTKVVTTHMKEWAKDAEKALQDILDSAHTHGKLKDGQE